MRDRLFEKELKSAVHEVCVAMAAWDASAAVPYKPSGCFLGNLDAMLRASERRVRHRRTLLRVAACFAAVLLVFSVVCAASPSVWAAVRSWFVNIISPDRLVYEFNHEENDHAFLVVRPDNLPEGFELSEINEGPGFSDQVYFNQNTGKQLTFSYRWATVGDLNKQKKLEKKYGTINIFMGQQAVASEEQGTSKLSWYDGYSGISYWAESDLPLDALINVFKDSIVMHPPIYEPAWLPDGYVLYDVYIDPGSSNLVYYNESNNDIISIECGDLGAEDRVFVDGAGSSKDMVVNGIPSTVYWGEEAPKGTVLVMVDESKNMVFTVFTGLLDPDLAVRIAESLQVVDELSKNMP